MVKWYGSYLPVFTGVILRAGCSKRSSKSGSPDLTITIYPGQAR
jgi:hypothetical protein